MNLVLEREASTQTSTPGVLFVNGVKECFTLEDVVREKRFDDGALIPVQSWKVPGETAIPSGRYQIIIDFSERFKRLMPHIIGVPGFDGVRIHSGNTAADTEGCILLGRVRSSPDEVLESRFAFDTFFEKLKAAVRAGEETFIVIHNPQV